MSTGRPTTERKEQRQDYCKDCLAPVRFKQTPLGYWECLDDTGPHRCEPVWTCTRCSAPFTTADDVAPDPVLCTGCQRAAGIVAAALKWTEGR